MHSTTETMNSMGEAFEPDQACTEPVDDDDCYYAGELISNECEYWARLYPARSTLKAHDLTGTEVTFGRLRSCNITVTNEELPSKIFVNISKIHFKISRDPSTSSCVILRDLSMNGTYVNNVLVGSRSFYLRHNDRIAVTKPDFGVYYFVENTVSSKLPMQLQDKYHVSQQLGTGAFGVVNLVFNKISGKGYAMKTLIKNNKNARKLRHELQKLDKEIQILQTIRHPNVIGLIDVVDCVSEKFLILELMGGGDLYDRITSCCRLTEQTAKLYIYQIVSGVDYLHSMGIIHRDLKPENVLLACENSDTVLKISDFGLSKVLHSETEMDTLCGTKMYVAPEILDSGGLKAYTAQVDVWSMGVILYVCLSGQTPFSPDRNGVPIEEQIKKGSYTMHQNIWGGVSSQAKLLVRKMMNVNPEGRLSLAEILHFSWLNDTSMKSKLNNLIAKYSLPNHDDSWSFWSPLPANIGFENCNHSPARKRVRHDEDSDTNLFDG